MVFEPLRYTRSGVTGRFVPLGGAEEDGILADGLVERRQGSVCSYYGWWNGEGVPTSVASLWLVTVGVGSWHESDDKQAFFFFDIKTIEVSDCQGTYKGTSVLEVLLLCVPPILHSWSSAMGDATE
ncbi:hypothetical protein INT45_003188 [Circinella minor]|uniref:Uncharacterized protein n=1 Tax=Circinella minor TaxID=1195481 RepID=A0A8H7RRY9_9FUNG|nr:hypothetical protein INT45_003188 [Circinella minor]